MTLEIPKLIENFGGSPITALKRIIETRLNKVHTTTIGVIQSFDAETQTAVVQPAIKRVISTENKETITYTTENYPVLVNVPVVFPGGGDWFLTFPVTQGDECILFSMESSIANWRKNGGVQDPSHYKRKLSLKDAVAMVGLQSKASSLPSFNASEPEIRNRDGSVKLTMTASGITLMDSTDNAVRYSSLETAFNELNDKYNKLITAFDGWTPVANDGGAVLKALLTPLAPLTSTADITGAKVEEILVP